MLKVINVVYYSHNDHDKPQEVLKIHAPSNGFAPYIKDKVAIQFVKHLNYEAIEKIDGIQYAFFKRKNNFWSVPFKTHRYIKDQKPDIIMIEGLVFPLQLMMLKWKLGKRVKIIAQYHGEKPFSGIRGFFQKKADGYIDRYLFTSIGNASEWLDKGIISNPGKCCEVLEASTYFKQQDKIISSQRCGMERQFNFLWVGSLDSNKDPLTVINGFEKFIETNSSATLYMIYQQDDLLPAINEKLKKNKALERKVILRGRIEHDELPHWFSAADFYFSASHKESSSYALLEAMACGCIPVVTSIPSFKMITDNGRFGFLYPVDNSDALYDILKNLKNINTRELSETIMEHFISRLHFKNIAEDLEKVFNKQ